MNVRIEGNCKKPTKQWPNNLYYEYEFIAEHYLNTLVKFWNFSHRISRLRAIDCSSCDCVSRHDDCSRGWDFISGVWPFSNFFLNIGRERRWPRWIKKASHIGSKRLCSTSKQINVPVNFQNDWDKTSSLGYCAEKPFWLQDLISNKVKFGNSLKKIHISDFGKTHHLYQAT